METEKPHDDLTALFKAEDEALPSTAFVKQVMAPIAKRSLRRQAWLFGAGGLGLGAAISQLVSFASTRQPTGNGAQIFNLPLQNQFTSLPATIEPIWLITAAMVALCIALMAVMERA